MEYLLEYSSMDPRSNDRLADLMYRTFREGPAANFAPLASLYELRMRKNIKKLAGEVMGFFPTLYETATMEEAAATAAETNCSVEDALGALRRISDGDHDSGVPEFQRIVGKLPTDDLRTLEKLLEDMYYTKLRSQMAVLYPEFKVGLGFTPTTLAPFRGAAGVQACILEAELMIRKRIINMAGKVKGFFPTLTGAAAAETNCGLEDAMKALRRISNNSGVPEFQRIVEKLPADDLRTLEKLLEEPYHTMLRSEVGIGYMLPEVKAGDSFATKFAGQAIGVMVAKVGGAAVFGAFDTRGTTIEPFEKAAGALGLMSVLGGMMLQGKKPGFAKPMLKFGSVAIALGMIWSMTGNLDDVILSWIFGLIAAAIVGLTATFA